MIEGDTSFVDPVDRGVVSGEDTEVGGVGKSAASRDRRAVVGVEMQVDSDLETVLGTEGARTERALTCSEAGVALVERRGVDVDAPG